MVLALAAKSSLLAGRVARFQGASLNRKLVSRPVRALRVVPQAASKEEVSGFIIVKLKELIPDLEATAITAETPFADLNIDSLDFVEVLLELEKEYDVKLSEAAVDEISTVGKAAELILSKQVPA